MFTSDATDLLGVNFTDGNDALDVFLGEQPGVVQFSSDTAEVTEGDPGDTKTVTVTVTRSGGAAGEVKVDCKTADDSAIAGSDYDDTTQTLTWTAGDMASKDCTINIVNDIQFENDE
jgi:VCBS repeat-containing protein